MQVGFDPNFLLVRFSDDGSDWMPSKNSRICSDHFVNNEPSNIESHPGYIPTQFPLVYKKRNSDPDAQVRRFGR